jgi:thiosulfate dehydrogenase
MGPHTKTASWTVVGTIAALALLGFVGVKAGVMPANADAKPPGLERWAAKTSLKVAIHRDIRGLHDPLPSTDAVMTLGVKLYGTNCAVCHGAADGKASSVAQGLYQRPPQFAKDDVTDDPVEMTYWKITHGIRFTGMPSYVKTLTENQRWAIATFLRHQDSLPPDALAAWKALPSATREADTPSAPST